MLAKSKLNSIETLLSQALTDMEISHEEFLTIMKEKDKYEKMKENVKDVSEKQENMRLNSANSRTQKIDGWQIIYATNDFDWLKNIVKNNPKIIKHLYHQKKFLVCVCIIMHQIRKEAQKKCEIEIIDDERFVG